MTTKLTTTTEKATTWEERLNNWIKTQYGTAGDTQKLKSFIASELSHQREAIVEKSKKAIIMAIEETTKEHGHSNVYIDMVGEIFLERFDDIIKKVGKHD